MYKERLIGLLKMLHSWRASEARVVPRTCLLCLHRRLSNYTLIIDSGEPMRTEINWIQIFQNLDSDFLKFGFLKFRNSDWIRIFKNSDSVRWWKMFGFGVSFVLGKKIWIGLSPKIESELTSSQSVENRDQLLFKN
jgi:hypothetical protein